MGSSINRIEIRNKKWLLGIMLIYFLHFTGKKSGVQVFGYASYYLGDILFLPIALSIALIGMQLILKNKNYRISRLQVFGAFVFYSLLFEWYLPFYKKMGTSDQLDILMYAIGGILFYTFFNPRRKVYLMA